MNKSFLLILFTFFCFSFAQAQDYSFGIKGGLNYAMGGELTGVDSGAGYNSDTFNAESKSGYHAGIFFQLKFGKFFVRPEVFYNYQETEFSFPVKPSIYTVERLTVPLLVGYNVLGPVDIYAGPAYQSIMDSTLDGTQPVNQAIVVQNTPLSAEAGVKVSLGRFELDVRYDRNLSTKETQRVDIDNKKYGVNLADFTDARLHQVLVSLAFKIGDSEKKSRRRGGNCYF